MLFISAFTAEVFFVNLVLLNFKAYVIFIVWFLETLGTVIYIQDKFIISRENAKAATENFTSWKEKSKIVKIITINQNVKKDKLKNLEQMTENRFWKNKAAKIFLFFWSVDVLCHHHSLFTGSLYTF